ncbi:MAG: sulfatase [Planctomycetota bacterium]
MPTRILNCRAQLLTVLCLISLSAGAADRPNIVWLMSEDNSVHHLRLYHASGAAMPNIEALAEHGLVFNHAFSNGAVCSVARTTLITSCYAPRIGTQYHRRAQAVPMPRVGSEALAFFPAYLREAGYYTANNHKTDYNAQPGQRKPWDRSDKNATWRDRAQGQPFFYVQTIATTHESRLHFPDTRPPTQADPDQMVVAPIYPDTPLLRYTYARYHDQHAQIDRQFGQVIDKLREDGLMDDTFIFYFADHGGALPGSKGYAYDRGLHVPLVVYVPRNFAHLLDEPMREHGRRIDGFVEFVDFGPTVLHLAGVEVPDGIDGEAFMGQGVTLEQLDERDTAFGYADRFDEKYDLVRTLRVGKYKYIRSYQPFNHDGLFNQYRYRQLAYQQWRERFKAGELNDVQAAFFRPRSAEMLFDVEADPYETQNLAGDPRFVATLTELRGRLREQLESMPDLSFIPEPLMLMNFGEFESPAEVGRLMQRQIAGYLDIADLQLMPYDQAKPELVEVLQLGQVPKLYWGIIAATSFGTDSAELIPLVEAIAGNASEEPLLLARAAEFIALTGTNSGLDPASLLNQALTKSRSAMEALLVLNSAALLHETVEGFAIDPQVPEAYRENRWVKDRMEYLR